MIVTFSRGFQLPHGERNYGGGISEGTVLKIGDERTIELYNKLRDPQMRNMPFGLTLAIVAHASATFGDLSEWFKHQLHSNPNMSGARAGYLVDTMGYILTGRRTFDNELWLNMILDEGKPNATSRFKVDSTLYHTFFRLSSIAIYQNWISHTEGFSDLIHFMYTCFGNEINMSPTRSLNP